MSKEKAPAFQFYPRDLLSDINYQMMNYPERGMYWHLVSLCWLEESLPADLGSLSRILQVTPEALESAWRIMGKCFQVDCSDSTRLRHPRLDLERQKQADRRANSAIGGKRSAHKRKQRKQIDKQQSTIVLLPSKPQVNVNPSSSSASSSSSSTAEESGSLRSPGGNGHRDEAYETFKTVFASVLGSPYTNGSGKGDFVALTSLRKSLKIGTREVPEGWEKTCTNYCRSPMGKYSLADLCQCGRYAVFHNGETDRYGKPKESGQSELVLTGEPGSTVESRTSRGERRYIPKQ